MFELLCRLQAIKSFAKDCHYNFQEYSQHLLADVNGDDLSEQMDLVNEICFLGVGMEAPKSEDVLNGALQYIPEVSQNDQDNFRRLKLLIKETLVYLQQTEAESRGGNALLDNIAMTLQQLHGLLYKQVDDERDEEALENSIPNLMDGDEYNSTKIKNSEFKSGDHPRDGDGKFTSDGNDSKKAIASSDKYDIVELELPKEEYGKIMHELNTNLSKEERSKKQITKYIGNYRYTVVNKGFNEYTIIRKDAIND